MPKQMMGFVRAGIGSAVTGSWKYYSWMGLLLILIAYGAFAYITQLKGGLAVTGMNDVVSWGLYISNFTFLVGMAAAAVMLVLPAYIFKDVDFRKAVLIGEGVAVGALIMCMCFVTVDLGGPQNLWHLLPGIGYFNWPDSMLTWDILVLNGYLALNLLVPAYLLFSKYRGEEPDKRKYVPFVILSVFWAVSIHLVTAFLYTALPARPLWNNALLGPRFLASAFAAGPAFILLVLAVVNKMTEYKVEQETIRKLALVITVAAQINIIMLGSELFKEFYHVTEHSASAVYLFFGLDGHNELVPWIRTAVGMSLLATILLTINPIRRKKRFLYPSCVLLFVGIWIEKGMGLIVPGFIPSPLGEIATYSPTWVEIGITLGIWALGLAVLSVLTKVAVDIETGKVRAH